MPKRLPSLLSFLLLALSPMMMSGVVSLAHAGTSSTETGVSHERIGMTPFRYSAFLKNWDTQKYPVLSVLIDDLARYNQYFHAAAYMGNSKPMAPEADFFRQYQLLVVSRVITAPNTKEPVFTIERLIEKSGQLELHYRYVAPGANSTYQVSDGLVLQLPRRPYKKVLVFENGTRIATLNPDQGQWGIDTPAQPVAPVPVR